jgi:hypothetical protein
MDDTKKRSWKWDVAVVSLLIIGAAGVIASKLSLLTGRYTDIAFLLLVLSLASGWLLKYLLPDKPKQ